MKGTFKEILNYYGSHDLEFDAVIGGEEMEATYSFNGTPHFSKYCEEKYGDLLNAETEIKPDLTGRYTDAVIVNYPDARKGKEFTMAWAGYVSESEYKKLFEED